jgi:parallel beta-helix repeat protein
MLSEGLIPMNLFGSHYEKRDGKPLAVATKIVATDGSGNFEDIQSAIDDLPSGGGVVYIKEGTYEISTSLLIRNDNTALIGAGKSTQLKVSGTSNNLITLNGKDGCLIKDLYLNCNAENSSVGIYLINACTETIILNVWTDNTGTNGAGMLIHGNSNVVVSNCNISSHTTGDGIYLSDCTGARIIGNHIHDNDNGVLVEADSDKNIIMGNTTNTNTKGIHIKDANCDKNVVVANISTSDTAAITDAGTNTDLGHNVS